LCLGLVCALAACDSGDGGTLAEKDAAPAPAPSTPASKAEAEQQAALDRGEIHEPPPLFDSVYAPASKTAESITDTLSVGGDEIQFGFGHTYTTEAVRMASDAEIAAYRRTASLDRASLFEVRKVTQELVNPRAQNGGLCSPEATTFILLGAVLDAEGHTDEVAMLAYKGKDAPTAGAAERDLCGTFLYARADAAQ
jgi:hypothetical protein